MADIAEGFVGATVGGTTDQSTVAFRVGKEKGVAAASGRAGRSRSRVDQSITSQLGRNLATQSASLISAQVAQSINQAMIANQLKIANLNAYAPIATGPCKPMELPRPVFEDGPRAF